MKSVVFNNEVCDKYRDLADKIKNNLEVNGTVISEKEKEDVYFANLPEGITKKEVIAVRKYDADFLKASELAIGETAAAIFKKDIHAEKVTAQIGAGQGGKITSVVNRERTYPNNFAKEGESKTIVKKLAINTKAELVSTRGIGALREAMSNSFEG